MLGRLLVHQLELADDGKLSAGSLEEAIQRVEVRRDEVLVGLFGALADRYGAPGEYSAVITDEDDEQYCRALALLPAEPELEAARDVACRLGATCAEAQSLERRRKARAMQARFSARLQEWDAVSALRDVRRTAALLVQIETEAAAAGDDLDAIQRGALRQQRAAIELQLLERVVSVSRTLDEGEGASPPLSDVWDALEVLGLTGPALGRVAETFFDSHVEPICSSSVSSSATMCTPERGPMTRLAGDRVALTAPSPGLSAASSATDVTDRGGSPSRERRLYAALKKLCHTALLGDAERVERVGLVLWPKLAAAYLEWTPVLALDPGTHVTAEAVAVLGRAAARATHLEAKAGALGLLEVRGAEPEPLTKRATATVARAVHAVRASFLADVGGCLAAWDSREAAPISLLDPGGNRAAADAPASSRLVVTAAMAGALALTRRVLTAACDAGVPGLTQAMAGAVVEAAISVADWRGPLGAEGAAVEAPLLLPYPAALRYNDCVAFSALLSSLPTDLAPRLQAQVHRAVNFANPCARVRRAGQRALDAMLECRAAELGAVADEACARIGGGGAVAADGIAMRRAVVQLLAGFRRLGATLRDVLQPGTHLEVAATLIDAACNRITGALLGVSDISVDESEQLPAVFRDLLEGAPDAALGIRRGESDEEASVNLREALFHAAPGLVKLKEMFAIMEIRLSEIEDRWTDGRLSALGLSAAEVSHLVRALFEDTGPRQALLKLLARS